LPGCAAWGFSKDDVLAAITKTAQQYVRMLLEKGVTVPDNVTTLQTPVVAVTL
jgi:predicted RNase H-like HicB family nuclease